METVQAPCLFATHFHEMTTMSDKHKRAKNSHVTAEAKVRGGEGRGRGHRALGKEGLQQQLSLCICCNSAKVFISR